MNLLLLLEVIALAALQQQPALPPLLQQALKLAPEVRLLDPTKDSLEYTREQIEKFGYWPPWLELDVDRDMRPDIVAVVVTTSPRREFGVLALHSSNPRQVEWVVPLDVDPINGVAKGSAADVVVPLFCIECDSNVWFRWSGEEYEPGLHAAGERIDVGTETQADVMLYTAPNLASKPVTTVPHCSTVTVVKVGGTPDRRWYFVETSDNQSGWVPETVISDDICVG